MPKVSNELALVGSKILEDSLKFTLLGTGTGRRFQDRHRFGILT